MLIAHDEHGYLRSPRLVPTHSGADLYAIATEARGEAVLRLSLDSGGQVAAESEVIHRSDAIVALAPALPVAATEDPADDHRAIDGEWEAKVVHDGGSSSVVVRSSSGSEHTVWRGTGIAVSPAVAATETGAWVAFHTDVREDTGQADVAKWIVLRFVNNDGGVFEPAAPMVDRDRDRQGEEQSFEFPSLVVGVDGAVDLFGRGSHNFYRQRLNINGWSPRQPLSDGGWGCRGRRVTACKLGEDKVVIARREKKGLEVTVLDEPSGGRPAMVPTSASIHGVRAEGEARRERAAKATRSTGRGGRTTVGVGGRDKNEPAPGLAWSGPRVLFGDIQQHSAHSDGIGSADECYLRSRYRYGDDFAALTDHESFLGKKIGPGEWAYLQSVTEAHNDPGQFATIVAYEWTGKAFPGPGHKVIYLDGPGHDIVSRDDVPDGKGIVERVIAMGAFTGPHHIGWTGADAASHDPRGQPVWEICSCHGCYEHPDNPLGARGELGDQFAQPMLDQGHRFGFIACSDSHGLLWHHGECRKRDPFRTGLTAVLSETCTREAILEAIRNRRCYATSGAKILVDLQTDRGITMGAEIKTSTEIEIRVVAQGKAPLASIELITPSGVAARQACQGFDGSLVAAVHSNYVYARVTQVDGEQAWTSPIFMDG